MKKTLAVVSYEIRATLARKAFLIMGLGLPLLAGLIVLAVIWINRDTGSAPAVAETTTDVQQVAGYVDPGGLIEVIPGDIPDTRLLPYPDAGSAQAALEAGDVDGYYLIPADYLESGERKYLDKDQRSRFIAGIKADVEKYCD